MSNARRDALRQAARHLAQFGQLSRTDCDAVEHLPGAVFTHRRGEEAPGAGLHLIVSGWACKMRPLGDGRRQIFVFLLPGDFIGTFRPRSCPVLYRTVALTGLETTDVTPLLTARSDGSPAMPAVVQAGQRLEECAHGLLFDHVVRLGAHDAYGGLADLLLELRGRLARVGQVDEDGAFTLPIGQRVLAEALGVSVVHINQTLKRLAADGLIQLDGGRVRLVEAHTATAVNLLAEPFGATSAANPLTTSSSPCIGDREQAIRRASRADA